MSDNMSNRILIGKEKRNLFECSFFIDVSDDEKEKWSTFVGGEISNLYSDFEIH